MKIVTHSYEAQDWPRVSQIHDLARPIELQGSCDPRAFVPLADDKDDLEQFQQCHKLVAWVDQTIVGFIGIQDRDVGWLYVDPRESRKGIGRHLLQAGLEQISGRACVHVLEGNTPALQLYQSEGFKTVRSFKSKNNGYPCIVVEMSQ